MVLCSTSLGINLELTLPTSQFTRKVPPAAATTLLVLHGESTLVVLELTMSSRGKCIPVATKKHATRSPTTACIRVFSVRQF